MSASRPGISPTHQPRADSPALGGTPDGRVGSEVSVTSASNAGHLRGISDTSVSTDGQYAGPRSEPVGEGSRAGAVSPEEPAQESGDYLRAGLAPSPSPSPHANRRSQFSEKLDEADER